MAQNEFESFGFKPIGAQSELEGAESVEEPQSQVEDFNAYYADTPQADALTTHLNNSENLLSGTKSAGLFISQATISGAVSLFNSALAIGNVFIPEENEFEEVDKAELFRKYDEKWGEFYERNQGAVDVVGDLGALFVPGTLAMKLVNGAAKGNRALKAFDLFDTVNRRKAFIQSAAKADVTGQVASQLFVQNLKTAGFEALNENVVFSALSALMLNESSFYDDYGAKTFVFDVGFGALITGPLKFLGTRAGIRSLKTAIDLEFNKVNPVRGATVVETKDITVLSLLEDAENTQDATRAGQLRNKAKQEFTTLINAGEYNDLVVARLTKSLDSLTAEEFASRYVGTKEIRLFDKSKDVDLADPRNIRTKLEQLNLIKRAGGREDKVEFFAIVPEEGFKKSSLFGKEVFTSEKDAQTVIKQFNLKGKVQKFHTRGSYLFNPTKALTSQVDEAGRAIYAPRRIDFIKSKIAGRSSENFLKDIQKGLVEAPETYIHLDLKTGRAVESGFELTAGDHGLKFNTTLSRIDMGDRRFSVADELKHPEFSYLETEPAVIDALRLITMERAKEAPASFFKLTHAEADAFIKANTATGLKAPSFALSATDLLEVEAAYALSATSATVPMRLKNGSIKFLTRSEIEQELISTKKGLVNSLEVSAYNADDLEVRLGIDVADFIGTQGQKGFSTFGNINDLRTYKAPRHLTLTRNLNDFPSRAKMLAQLDIESSRLAQQQSVLTNLSSVWAGIFDLSLLGRLNSKLVTRQTETAGLLRGSSGEEYASVASFAETNGSLLNKAQEVLRTKLMKPLLGPVQNVKQDPRKLEEFNFLYNRIRSLPADYETVYLPDGTARLKNIETGEILKRADDTTQEFTISKDVAEMHRSFQDGPVAQFIKFNNARVEALGKGKLLEPRIAYYPGQDLKKSPYTAFVKSPNGQVRSITASTKELLDQKMAEIRKQIPAVEITTLKEVKDVAKLYDDVDASDIFDDVEFDSALKRSGAFASFDQPLNTNVLEDLSTWISTTSNKWIRRTASDVLAQEFYELRFLGDALENVEKSTLAGVKPEVFRKGNPFHDVIKTSLNITKFGEYETLSKVNQTVEGMVSTAVGSFRKTLQTVQGTPAEEAAANAARDNLRRAAGIDFDYSEPIARALADKRLTGTELKSTVSVMNNIVGSLALAWDVLQPIVNAISLPMLAWPELRALRSKLATPSTKALEDSMLYTVIPGTKTALPTPTKIMAQVIKELFTDPAYRERLKKIPTIDATAIEAVDTIQGLTKALTAPHSAGFRKDLAEKINRANETVKKYTVVGPASWQQIFSHAIAEKMARAAGLTDESVIRTIMAQFSKRTNGNYVGSQRPAILQGSIGHAAGLFQTWTFQVFQNLARYIGEGDRAALAAFVTAHTSFFGIKSNPLFGAVNNHIANRDAQNRDIYTRTAGSEVGETLDFLLYGAPSAWSGVSLYTRGDLTPRTPVLLPTSFADIPMVSAVLRTYRGIAGFAEKVGQGAPGKEAFLEAVALSSINRPLAGLAQVMLGRSLFNAQGIGGQTITADIQDASAWTRIIGGRPFAEQKMLDAYYRNLAYEAKDNERVKILGAAIRTRLSTGQDVSPEEWSAFAEKYYSAGGNVKNFKKFVQRQIITTNTNLSTRIYKTMHDSEHMSEWRSYMEAQDAGQE